MHTHIHMHKYIYAYTHGRYSMKVVTVHPLSEMFLDKIDDARKSEAEEKARLKALGEDPMEVCVCMCVCVYIYICI